jgi:bacterioferritin
MARVCEDLPKIDIHKVTDRFAHHLPCRSPQPFPKPKVSRPNLDYANMLLDAYADGETAELTAITQYVHHSMTIPNKAVSNLELCISIVEMQHLMTIGSLIEKLGLDPKYWRTNRAYWSGGNVMYGKTMCQKLQMDIDSEIGAIQAYNRLIHDIKDPHIVRILERIVADEKVHLCLFKKALAKYC